jgi:S1-C subfamily serine protease
MDPRDWTVDPGEGPPQRAASWVPGDHGQIDPTLPDAPRPQDTSPLGERAVRPGPVFETPPGEGPPAVPPAAAPPTGGRPPSRSWWFALAAVIVLVAAAVGFSAGRFTSDSSASGEAAPFPFGTTSEKTGSATTTATTATTAPAPLKGDEVEPAAAVAKVLGPAVVQLQNDRGLGSGVLYDRSGLILTAAHVVGSASSMMVRLADGTQTTGKVLGSDDATDIAVVKIDVGHDVPVAVLATGVKLEVGQIAIAIGSPYGFDQSVTQGIVSAINRSIPTPGGEVPMVQTDAPINPGNSGGALADRFGRVIGINDAIYTSSSGSDATQPGNVGVGFAVPIDLARAVADRLVAGKKVEQGALGVRVSDASGSHAGAQIQQIESGSPAQKAGLKVGDVVVRFDGNPVQSSDDLAGGVKTHQPGDEVTLEVLRSGETLTLHATLDAASGD